MKTRSKAMAELWTICVEASVDNWDGQGADKVSPETSLIAGGFLLSLPDAYFATLCDAIDMQKCERYCMKNRLEDLPFGPGKLFIAENYLEAVGIMGALRAGVAASSVRRPLEKTRINP